MLIGLLLVGLLILTDRYLHIVFTYISVDFLFVCSLDVIANIDSL